MDISNQLCTYTWCINVAYQSKFWFYIWGSNERYEQIYNDLVEHGKYRFQTNDTLGYDIKVVVKDDPFFEHIYSVCDELEEWFFPEEKENDLYGDEHNSLCAYFQNLSYEYAKQHNLILYAYIEE